MKIMKLFSVLLLTAGFASAQIPTGEWILQKVDENIGSDNKISMARMVIHGRRGSRSIASRSWIQGDEKSFTEYLSPPREKGTKMLKIGDQLWMYTPSADRTIMISGHMLRQSVMGSDLSYEDMMEDRSLIKYYDAEVLGEEVLQDRACWMLMLTSKTDDIAYFSRKVWVDKERFVSMREERYAKSGKLIKTTRVLKVTRMENRWVPSHIVFKDELKTGKGTEFFLDSVEFNAEIQDYVFSKASLRR